MPATPLPSPTLAPTGAYDDHQVDRQDDDRDEEVTAGAGLVLRPHQVDAVDAAVAALTGGGSALVVMPCGTGKTLVGVATAEQLGARTVAVLVPTLTLAEQTAAVWAAVWPDAAVLAVCGDTTIAGHPATTDPAVVAAHTSGPGRRVVVATYQSSPQLTRARFDVVVADEAHHLAGPPPGPFGTLLRGEITARARLLLTATPRPSGVHGAGLDDTGRYGPCVYDLRFGDAVADGLLAPYRVAVAAVGRADVAAVTARLRATHPTVGVDEHLVAGAVATLRTMAELGLRRAVSFHSRTGRAHQFSSLVAVLAATLTAPDRPATPGWSAFVHAGTSRRDRRQVLARLAAGDGWGVVANARLLTEGFDLPELDCVALVDPKTSPVDITQAVGRVLRRAPGKDAGVIVLPVLVDDPADPGTAVDRRGLDLVAGTLDALRAHDPALGDVLAAARRTRGRRRGDRYTAGEAAYRAGLRARLRSHLDLRLPAGAAAALADAVAVHLVCSATADWDEWFGLLESWVDDHGTAAVPQTTVVTGADGTGWNLGAWASTQRAARRRGRLSDDRVAALEALPGWEWEPVDARFETQRAALAAWADLHGHAAPPLRAVHDGVKIGQFVNVARTRHADGVLDPSRAAALEALPGWTWDVRGDRWDAMFAALEAFVAVAGHARPAGDVVVDGVTVGRWVSKQRTKLTEGTLSDEQARRLRALPGWVDDVRDADWWVHHDVVAAFAAVHGRPPTMSETVDGLLVGRWVAKQRTRRRSGRLPADRAAALEALPGWSWAPRVEQDRFGAGFAALEAFVAVHGHARVPDRFVDPDGFPLGNWVGTQRAAHRTGRITADRAAALEALPGWAWHVHDARFAAAVAAVKAFAAVHGRLPDRDDVHDGIRVGDWVRNRRRELADGRLTGERAARVRALPHWDTPHDRAAAA